MDPMKFTINTPEGQTVDRKLYLVYGNTGSYEAPEWYVIGKRVEDSSAENDWSEEVKNDILGDTYGILKAPVTTQSFEPCEIDAGDKYQAKLVQLAVIDRDAQALASQDLLRVHLYLTDKDGNAFAERFPSSMVKPTSLGGEGGGSLTMPVEITFGGTREKGSAKVENKVVTFTPEEAEG